MTQDLYAAARSALTRRAIDLEIWHIARSFGDTADALLIWTMCPRVIGARSPDKTAENIMAQAVQSDEC
jgi:hypothetical protein